MSLSDSDPQDPYTQRPWIPPFHLPPEQRHMNPTNEVSSRPDAYAIVGRYGEIINFAVTPVGADLIKASMDKLRHQSSPHAVRPLVFLGCAHLWSQDHDRFYCGHCGESRPA